MKNFRFNKSGVCINPEIIFDNRTIYEGIALLVACKNNRWDFGIDISICNWGIMFGVSNHSNVFTSKEVAVEQAIRFVKDCLNSNITSNVNSRAKKKIEEFIFWSETRNQLSIAL